MIFRLPFALAAGLISVLTVALAPRSTVASPPSVNVIRGEIDPGEVQQLEYAIATAGADPRYYDGTDFSAADPVFIPTEFDPGDGAFAFSAPASAGGAYVVLVRTIDEAGVAGKPLELQRFLCGYERAGTLLAETEGLLAGGPTEAIDGALVAARAAYDAAAFDALAGAVAELQAAIREADGGALTPERAEQALTVVRPLTDEVGYCRMQATQE